MNVSDVMDDLYNWVNPKTKKHSPMISKETHTIILNNAEVNYTIFPFLNAFTSFLKGKSVKFGFYQ